MSAALRDRIEELLREPIAIVKHDRDWSRRYADEEKFLRSALPPALVVRIDHIGSTAVPGLSAKPIIDVQVEVKDLERVKQEVAPLLESRGYEFIWRPSIGERAPFYAWFIKRDRHGRRTHHVHIVEPDAASEDRILFRDHLRRSPEEARRYEELKRALSHEHPSDRAAYTKGKTDYIAGIVREARQSVHGDPR